MNNIGLAPRIQRRLLGTLGRRWLIGLTRVERRETVAGHDLIVDPGVLSPTLFRAGRHLAEFAAMRMPAAESVLDMGTGSGACAIAASHRALQVIAVDINPAAVRCATGNVARNELQDRIDVRHGDLFEPVANESFDGILFNPPFHTGPSNDGFTQAWQSVDVLERFAGQLPEHLKPGGSAWIIFSNFGDQDRLFASLDAAHCSVIPIEHHRFLAEVFTIYQVRPR